MNLLSKVGIEQQCSTTVLAESFLPLAFWIGVWSVPAFSIICAQKIYLATAATCSRAGWRDGKHLFIGRATLLRRPVLSRSRCRGACRDEYARRGAIGA